MGAHLAKRQKRWREIHCMNLPGGLRNQGPLSAKNCRRPLPREGGGKVGMTTGGASLAGRDWDFVRGNLKHFLYFSLGSIL